jgi:hypothetical protein
MMNDISRSSGCHVADSDVAPGLIVRRRNWGEGVVAHSMLCQSDHDRRPRGGGGKARMVVMVACVR